MEQDACQVMSMRNFRIPGVQRSILDMCVCEKFQDYMLHERTSEFCIYWGLGKNRVQTPHNADKETKKHLPRCRNLFSLHYYSTRTNESMTMNET